MYGRSFCFANGSLLCGLICFCLVVAGCTGGKTPAPGSATSSTTSGSTGEAPGVQGNEGDESLNTILDMLKLDALGFTSPEESVVGLVNQWQMGLSEEKYQSEQPISADEASFLKKYLSEEQVAQLRRSAFNRNDIERIRDILLLNAAAQNAATQNAGGANKSDLGRVESIFMNLVRNSDLITQRAEQLPLSLFNLALLGKMTASERAWLYTELLRQLKIDTVILVPGGTKSETAGDGPAWDEARPFLVGVLLNKQVYLFDPALGLPLTVPGTSAKKSPIATLEQVQANEKILRQYDVDNGKPYPFTAESLKTPQILITGDPSIWSYRFQRLQVAFTGGRAAVISDSLSDSKEQPGLVQRIISWPGKAWQPEQVSVWKFPSQQQAGMGNLSSIQKKTLEDLLDPLKMPAKAEKGKDEMGNDKEIRVPTNQFMLARMDHVRGHLGDAVKGYTLSLTRLQNPTFRETPSERTRVAYVKAIEDARFWTAVCKLDQENAGDARVAADKFRVYLRSYPDGEWADACHVLLAQLSAVSGDLAAASEEIAKVTPQYPQYAGILFQKKQWAKPVAP